MTISYHQYYLHIPIGVFRIKNFIYTFWHFLVIFHQKCLFLLSQFLFYKVSTENGIRDRGLLVVLNVGKMSIQILVSLNRSNPVAFKQPGAF